MSENKAPLHSTSAFDKIESVNITDPLFKSNPFPYYAQLRDKAPVFPVTVTFPITQRAWLITRYDDVLSVLKDERFVKNPHNAMTPTQLKKQPSLPGVFKPLQLGLLSLDKPDHTRLRALVHKAFTPRMMDNMRQEIQLLTDELLDKAEQRGHNMDLIADFALPLPLIVISRIIGVPPHEMSKFQHWWSVMATAANNRNMLQVGYNAFRLINYLGSLIRKRTENPQNDLVTALVQAKEGDSQLTKDEIVAMLILLLSAGHETTVNLISSGMLALIEHPDQMALLGQSPDSDIAKSAIEEIVRYVCPVETATERYATQDIKISGVTIPRGELVLAVVASANRDGAYFSDPERFDITRQNNKHLGFGQGIHYCIGAPLARLEGQIALSTLVRRFPNLRLAVSTQDLRWRGSFIVRGLESLPVTF